MRGIFLAVDGCDKRRVHAEIIGNGLPVQFELSPGQMNDAPMAELLLNDLLAGAEVIAD